MVSAASKNNPHSTVIGSCTIPAYCIKSVGSRHVLIGGGGGGAKTGVSNEIQLFLMNYDSTAANGKLKEPAELRADQTHVIKTDRHSVMNMDVVSVSSSPSDGRYLLATGEDEYCGIYLSNGFLPNYVAEDASQKLMLPFQSVLRFKSDKSAKDSYQKCARFYPAGDTVRLVTGGADGYARVWDISSMLHPRNANQGPLFEMQAGSEVVNDVDVSPCGTFLVTLASECAQGSTKPTARVKLWDANTGKLLEVLPAAPKLDKFVTISTLTISGDSEFIGIGTLEASIGIFEKNTLDCLYFAKETHSSFVTAVEFLPRRSRDVANVGRLSQNPASVADKAGCFLPGVCSDVRAALISLSVDNSIQVHRVPFPVRGFRAFTGANLRLAVNVTAIYVVIKLVHALLLYLGIF
ncbi:Protein SEC-12 [Aphelenchoides avenae]|nr:Protein SEC-12 [Aphelenchus avenae]